MLGSVPSSLVFRPLTTLCCLLRRPPAFAPLSHTFEPPEIWVPMTAVFRPLTITQPGETPGPNTSWCIGPSIALSFLQFLYSQSQFSIPCLRLSFCRFRPTTTPQRFPRATCTVRFVVFVFLSRSVLHVSSRSCRVLFLCCTCQRERRYRCRTPD
jgi:hypothetical protein